MHGCSRRRIPVPDVHAGVRGRDRLPGAACHAFDAGAVCVLLVCPNGRYDNVSKLLATVEPYVTLWTTINEFYNSFSSWMGGPFWKLSPEQVEAETTDAFRSASGCLRHASCVAGSPPVTFSALN